MENPDGLERIFEVLVIVIFSLECDSVPSKNVFCSLFKIKNHIPRCDLLAMSNVFVP